MYVVINCKPENGCEIKNSACGQRTIMMHLKIVNTPEEESTHTMMDDHTGMIHGTKMLVSLVKPLLGTGCTVCGDYYFASVGASMEMESRGMSLLVVVKTSTRHFPMAYLTKNEMEPHG